MLGSRWRRRQTEVAGLQAAAGCLLFLVGLVQAKNSSQATTAPWEAEALNSVLRQWGKPANVKQWNTTGDPCSGSAINGSISIDDTAYNPFIKCNCSYDNGTTCHITGLKVYALDAIGVLPDELWNLNFLTNLDLRQNYLTGPISSSIGNLTHMQYLSFGTNALSGKLPRELGRLTKLKSLSFATNSFSGSLPAELGNLTALEQLYLDSSGVTGEIPSTFADLQNLVIVSASDIELTGSIPAFIGNWTKLTDLRLQGNSFVGSIPSTFANLISLNTLRIIGIANGSSSLAFIKNLKSLEILVLRHNNISDSLPSSFGDYKSLYLLDLSFNSITGQIPNSLFNLSSLSYLFLGNNKLNGSLPAQKTISLFNIDLSYNELSGSFPSWVSNYNLQLNLVANNFTVTASNSSVLPLGLNCLQQNFPCYQGSPIYGGFAVNCGGPQITSSDKTVYERDSETLGPATVYETDTDRWAVSNAGWFISNNNVSFTGFSSSQVTNTLDSELFQTARLSPGSLRYYGLGLQNGNYTVLLQFAEIIIVNGQTWKSLGRRVFDIYIQGKRELRNFDIRKEAGTCCVPQQGTYGPSISAISVIPNFTPIVSNRPPTEKKNNAGLILGISVPLGIVVLVTLATCFFIQRWRSSHVTNEDDLQGVDARPYTFNYAELRSATEDFNSDNKLGEGGFGPVYKGTLSDGRIIAVKQLSVASHQGKSQFVAEIATISTVQHRNLVKLYGCCIEGAKRLLVYEYLENKSLDQALFGNYKLKLDWAKRFHICMGVARGLGYLHQESRLRIVHRDIKASNILLDSDLNPKISDFGLAKLYDDKVTHISTRVAGTIGYLAPEYALRGHLTEKVDVFGFGVVALEIVSGRPNTDASLEKERIYLLEWAWYLHENNRDIELVDERLSEFSEKEVKRVIQIALLCTQTSPAQRPPMSRVVAMLSGDIEVGTIASKPGYLTDLKLGDSSFLSNKTSTSKAADSSMDTSMPNDLESSPLTATEILENEIIEEGK
ncbi:hypothetical protein Nepgr_001158 [Nepenthes gracilis]|uniref:non-specific serine/threonine protein kinase n=1 Tax=Nepenthes gracilis TaxID=150966 RepID=A0AAD3P7R8_NEPGR|nr:hypothetical protein Nepgr_001158 [Nepenthes gracilis]